MARGRARPVVRTQKNVNYTWSTFVAPAAVTVPAASKVLLGFFFLATAFEETVVRVRGGIGVLSDAGALEQQIGAFGMIRATDRAVAAGAASIPGPVTDGDDDGWFVWQPWSQSRSIVESQVSVWYPIDSKAQRIVREGQQLAVMVENAYATHGMQVLPAIRALSRFRS